MYLSRASRKPPPPLPGAAQPPHRTAPSRLRPHKQGAVIEHQRSAGRGGAGRTQLGSGPEGGGAVHSHKTRDVIRSEPAVHAPPISVGRQGRAVVVVPQTKIPDSSTANTSNMKPMYRPRQAGIPKGADSLSKRSRVLTWESRITGPASSRCKICTPRASSEHKVVSCVLPKNDSPEVEAGVGASSWA